MCQTNSWKELSASIFNSNLKITARRSDGVIFRLIEESNIENLNTTFRFKSLLDKIETYRNCKCTNDLRCDLHIIKIEKEQ